MTEEARITTHEWSNGLRRVWSFVLGASLVIGAWTLVILPLQPAASAQCTPESCSPPAPTHPAVVRVAVSASSGSRCYGTGTLIEKGNRWATILTCAHLFRDGNDATMVSFPDGSRFAANLLGIDQAWDLAALQIASSHATPVNLADDFPKPGDPLVSCGYGPDGRYSAFVTLGVDRQGIIYLEADLARRPTPQIVADGVELCRRFRPDAFGVEANQFQDLLASQFEAEFGRQGMLGVRPHTLDNRVNKLVRIRRLGPYLSGRRLRFKSGSPSTQLLVDQLKEFPISDHDDGPDAAEMAIRLAAELLGSRTADDGLGHRLPVG